MPRTRAWLNLGVDLTDASGSRDYPDAGATSEVYVRGVSDLQSVPQDNATEGPNGHAHRASRRASSVKK